MDMKTHGDNLIQLTRLIAFSCYFVREADGLTLVDTNLPGSARRILEIAQQLDQSIKRIALTHAHADHVGSLDDLVAALDDVEVLVSEREAALMAGDMSLLEGEPQDKVRGGYPSVEARPTRKLTNGDRVGSLEVVASPGHTPGHIAFLDTRDQTLIAGDAFVTQGGLTVSGKFNILFPFPATATWHRLTALQSAIILRDLQPTRLAVGHGKVLESPVRQMDQAIAEAERSF